MRDYEGVVVVYVAVLKSSHRNPFYEQLKVCSACSHQAVSNVQVVQGIIMVNF